VVRVTLRAEKCVRSSAMAIDTFDLFRCERSSIE
jgi:hypothetical protein